MCWISVKDQVPDEGAEVDVWVADGIDGEPRRVCKLKFSSGEFCYPGFVYLTPLSKITGEEVTHWRYPPAPPHGATA